VLVSTEAPAEPLVPLDVLVSTEAPAEPLVPLDVLVSTEAPAEPLVPLDALVSTEALAEPPVPLEVPTSTDALGEPLVSTEATVPLVTEVVSRAWAIPGRTPPSRPAVATMVRPRRTHRRRRCRDMRVKNPLSPNDLSGSCTQTSKRGQASCLPLSVACTPPGDSKTRSLGVVRNRKSRLEHWVNTRTGRTHQAADARASRKDRTRCSREQRNRRAETKPSVHSQRTSDEFVNRARPDESLCSRPLTSTRSASKVTHEPLPARPDAPDPCGVTAAAR
jgi:hypothetical protein